MSKQGEFLSDVLDAIDDWDFEYETYNENGCFCIDITVDMDDWDEDSDDIWDCLDDVCSDWGAGIDSDMNTYKIAIEFD